MLFLIPQAPSRSAAWKRLGALSGESQADIAHEESYHSRTPSIIHDELLGRHRYRTSGVGVLSYSDNVEDEVVRQVALANFYQQYGYFRETWLVAARGRTNGYVTAQLQGEVLPAVRWHLVEGGAFPLDAIPAGYDVDADGRKRTLFAARFFLGGGVQVGK